MPDLIIETALQISAERRVQLPLSVGKFEIKPPIVRKNKISPGSSQVGTGDLKYEDVRTIAAGADDVLDLAGSLADDYGDNLDFAQVILIFVKADAANGGNLIVGGADSNAFAGPFGPEDTYTIKPGEWMRLESRRGWDIVGGATDNLKIRNTGDTAASYAILVLGRSVGAA